MEDFARNLARILGEWLGGNHGKLRAARPTGGLARLPVEPLVGSTGHGPVFQLTTGGVEDSVLSMVDSGRGLLGIVEDSCLVSRRDFSRCWRYLEFQDSFRVDLY